MTKFIIIENGVEYNDEIYYCGGEAAIGVKKVFDNILEAQTAKNEKLKEFLTKTRWSLSDFLDYELPTPLMEKFIEESPGSDKSPYFYEWGDFIDWAEKNNHDWLSSAPEWIYVIHQVEN